MAVDYRLVDAVDPDLFAGSVVVTDVREPHARHAAGVPRDRQILPVDVLGTRYV